MKNVFETLGFSKEESSALQMKADVYSDILKSLRVHHKNKTQMEIANILGAVPARVSELKNGKVDKFTLEKLLEYSEKLNPQLKYSLKSTAIG